MRSRIDHWVFGILLLLTACPGHGQGISQSKLTAHLIGGYTPGSSNIVAGKPRLLKVLALDSDFPSGMVQAMRDYKTNTPGGQIVVRVYSPKEYSLADDATWAAGDFWTNILKKSLDRIPATDRALIDHLEGPNEGQTPTLGYPWAQRIEASRWLNQFWTNLTPRIAAAGYKPCIGSIAVGNPGGNPTDWQPMLAEFVPALRQAKAAGGSWSYHSYTLQYTTDLNVEIHDSLRYRQFYSFFSQSYPDLVDIPLILTEGGVDLVGDRLTSGWQARGSTADYQRWLNWFDHRMMEDDYVLGCTLFQNGDTWWASFDLETVMPGAAPGVVPITTWLRDYLKYPTTVPPAPSGVSANAGSAITIMWTNVSLTPTTYNVKRTTVSGGPYKLVARNITEGVSATAFTDTAVTNGVTYCYVVTALNAAGEGPTSNEVSASPVLPRINCGGPGASPFLPDLYFSGGQSYSVSDPISTNGVADPAPQSVYRSQRYGDLTYTLPSLLPRASYKVRLHFAEMYVYFNAPGYRVFDVHINGARVLHNFDIVAAAGQYQAVVREFHAVSDSDGKMTIRLASVVNNASINGIELLANPATATPVAPTNLTAAVGPGHVLLNWFTPAGATSFRVKRSTISNGPYAVIASNLTAATFTDVSYTPNTTYYYVVSASNALGESPNSNQANAMPTNAWPDAIPTALTWTNTAIFPGDSVFFRVTVKNQGSATIGANSLGIGFKVDGQQVSWAGANNAPLAPGASATYTANGPGTGAWIATSGAHAITAEVDDINRFAEGNESNNALTVPLVTRVARYASNAGGPAFGNFTADNFYDGSLSTFSVTNAIDVSQALHAAPAQVYRSERWGDSFYLFPDLIGMAKYKVRLHFAEISPSVNDIGARRFHASINGTQVMTNFDILAAAGAKFRAVTTQFNTLADSAGQISISFTQGAANAPKISGIEIFPYTNTQPVLAAIGNKTVNANATLMITNSATDADIPSDTLSFALLSAPVGASVNSTSGLFTWTAPSVTAPQTNSVTVRVTDNGTPPMSDSKMFNIIVIPRPRFSSVLATNDQLQLRWQSFPGKSYRLEFKDDLSAPAWDIIGPDITASGYSHVVTNAISTNHQRFYRIIQVD